MVKGCYASISFAVSLLLSLINTGLSAAALLISIIVMADQVTAIFDLIITAAVPMISTTMSLTAALLLLLGSCNEKPIVIKMVL